MGYFDQLLSQPLPSAMMESGDEMDKEINDAMKAFDEACGGSKPYSEGCKSYDEGCKSQCEEGDEIDKELSELERECSVNGDLDDDDEDELDFDDDDEEDDEDEDDEEEGSKYRMPTSVDDPTPAEPVDEEDDAEADHAMNLAATPMLLQEELTEADCGKMCESGEMDILVDEGFLMESDIGLLGYDSDEDFMEGVFAPESRPYKMTKKARFQQLYALSLQIEARAHHDPFYPKMQKAYKIERTIKKGWEKRYGALAKRRALRYLKRLSKSKSPTVKKIVNKMIKK